MRVGILCFLCGCGLFPSLGDLTSGDAGVDAAIDAGASCPDGMAPAAGFCIDTTEVTNAKYEQFLASFDGGKLPECQWKTTFTPPVWPPAPSLDDYPVVNVDWCEAYTFCQQTGKRLCGRIGGGPVAQASATNATIDQWLAACSHAGALTYPYGNAYDASACNVPEHEAGILPVGSMAACVGGYPSIVDMVGNVYEWEDSCADAGGATDLCNARSGSFTDPPGSQQTCATIKTTVRNFRDDDVGFRCCSP